MQAVPRRIRDSPVYCTVAQNARWISQLSFSLDSGELKVIVESRSDREDFPYHFVDTLASEAPYPLYRPLGFVDTNLLSAFNPILVIVELVLSSCNNGIAHSVIIIHRTPMVLWWTWYINNARSIDDQ